MNDFNYIDCYRDVGMGIRKPEQRICEECPFRSECRNEVPLDDFDDSMDGDFDSGMASAGFGTDEDYGCFDDCAGVDADFDSM